MNSYRRAEASYISGVLRKEIFDVVIENQKGKPPTTVSEDEEYKKVDLNTFKELQTVFRREDGTITAGNSSVLCDGKLKRDLSKD